MIMAEKDQRKIPSTRGLRHVALKVSNLARSKAFYQKWFGMDIVWEPDAENVYMSSGVDNLALHQIPSGDLHEHRQGHGQFLDHLGFLMETPERVDQLYKQVVEEGVTIVHHPKQHRDDCYSFYLADPDHIVIQILYDPTISAIRFSS
jgi:catechol 2,3-dioxygenase-like lactoylglutathione lyase family enzyme